MKTTAIRYHDFTMGHTVTNHESGCRHLHGHNYRIHFEIKADLDELGRVLDFSVMKKLLCDWIENTWDHKFMIWKDDPRLDALLRIDEESLIIVPFNPTAENIAAYFLNEVAPKLLPENVELVSVKLEETRKCSVKVEK